MPNSQALRQYRGTAPILVQRPSGALYAVPLALRSAAPELPKVLSVPEPSSLPVPEWLQLVRQQELCLTLAEAEDLSRALKGGIVIIAEKLKDIEKCRHTPTPEELQHLLTIYGYACLPENPPAPADNSVPGTALRDLRFERGLSQEDVARAIPGWTQEMVSRAERGKRPVSGDELALYLKALDGAVAELKPHRALPLPASERACSIEQIVKMLSSTKLTDEDVTHVYNDLKTKLKQRARENAVARIEAEVDEEFS